MSNRENPPTKRSATVQARRRHILETATECFIKQGFHQTSTRDIASAAGISLGNLYNHFTNKAALIAEIASLEAEEMADMEAGLVKPGAPIKRVERFIRSYFDYVSLPENAVLTAEILAEAMRNPEITVGFIQNRDRLVSLLVQALIAGKDCDNFQFDQPPEDLAELMLDLIEGAGIRVALEKRGVRKRTKNAVVTMVQKSISQA